MVAILRGFLILSKATGQGAQPGTISKGIIHIFGGILAVNIVTTVKVMTNTFECHSESFSLSDSIHIACFDLCRHSDWRN